jgi:hypothetical protein
MALGFVLVIFDSRKNPAQQHLWYQGHAARTAMQGAHAGEGAMEGLASELSPSGLDGLQAPDTTVDPEECSPASRNPHPQHMRIHSAALTSPLHRPGDPRGGGCRLCRHPWGASGRAAARATSASSSRPSHHGA